MGIFLWIFKVFNELYKKNKKKSTGKSADQLFPRATKHLQRQLGPSRYFLYCRNEHLLKIRQSQEVHVFAAFGPVRFLIAKFLIHLFI